MTIEIIRSKKYRDELAAQLRQTPKDQRRGVLNHAKQSEEYQKSLIIHRAQARRTIEGKATEINPALTAVIAFAEAVKNAGGRALIVGGCVRDEIMGFEPKDYDIEVYGIEPHILEELSNTFGKVNKVGAAFGILKVTVGDYEIDVSLPRRESKTGKGHRDFSISADPYMSIMEAARRRDFTINTLAKDPLTGEIFDYFGGLYDATNRILRVTDEERFKDDPLRVLRGVQFTSRLGMRIDENSFRIMSEMVEELKFISKERIRTEWTKLLLKSPKPSLGLQAAMDLGIFHTFHPEVVELKNTPQEPEWHPEGDVWVHTLMVVDEAAKIIRQKELTGNDAMLIMFSAFCHDLGKPSTTTYTDGRIRSIGHEEAGVEPTIRFLSQIGIEGELAKGISMLVGEHLRPSTFYIEHQKGGEITDGAVNRLAKRVSPASIKHLVLLARADHLGRGPFIDPQTGESYMPDDYPHGEWLLQKAIEIGVFEKKSDPIILGRDLISFGLKPGRYFGSIIQAGEEMYVRGFTKDQILEVISQNKDKSPEQIIEALNNAVK